MSAAEAISLFGWQFLTGLALALFLPALGVLLRLRGEWLAALGFVHLAGAGGVAAATFGAPALLGALLVALAAASAKALARQADNSIYAAMILLGWAVLLLGAANHHGARLVGQAMIDGQLYFSGGSHLAAAVGLAALGALALRFLSPPLMQDVLLPGHRSANRAPVRLAGAALDALAALAATVAAVVMGVMPAFALIFVPAWVAFAIARNWAAAMRTAVAIGINAYVASFVVAIALDQPFGPTLVAVLLCCAPLRLLARG